MADLDRAIAAARKAMETKVHSLSDGEYILASRSRALRDLLAALDAARGEAASAAFSDWLAREMPAGTVIGDPHWWAKLIARRFAQFAVPPAAAAPMRGHDGGFGWMGSSHGAMTALDARKAPPAAAVPAANVTPMRQPRADLARLVESINAAVYANGNGLSVTEAIGALELAKLELLKEQEQ